MMRSDADHLQRFQESADLTALLQHASEAGLDTNAIRTALVDLEPIFESLSHGEHPNFKSLNADAIREHAAGAVYIAGAMAGSARADLKAAGLQVMGILDDSRFVGVLSGALNSDQTWLRLSAIEALGRMTAAHARPVLQTAANHPDPITRRAAQQALDGLAQ